LAVFSQFLFPQLGGGNVSSHGDSPFSLPVYGEACLYHAGRVVSVRKKGLALLYYLALEGVSRRKDLAEVLWDQPNTLGNLRVELYRLKDVFDHLGYRPFQGGDDPLQLSEFISLSHQRSSEHVLKGLDDVSPAFQGWLEEKRALLGQRQGDDAPNSFVKTLAAKLRRPHLILYHLPLGSSAEGFAQSLASEFRLPYLEGTQSALKGVRLVRHTEAAGALSSILSDHDNLWVVERPTYGDDPEYVLHLRSAWRSDRFTYLAPPALTWTEARAHALRHLPNELASKLYLGSDGHQEFLREAAAMITETGKTGLPQRFKATVRLELRTLSIGAQTALECLSVHPGPLPEALLETFEVKMHLAELERTGWLRFDRAWRFNHELTRRLLYASLPPGQRLRYHAEAARGLGRDRAAQAFHREASGETANAFEPLPLWADSKSAGHPPDLREVCCGRELALLELGRKGQLLDEADGSFVMQRSSYDSDNSSVTFELPGEPCLLKLEGQVFLEHSRATSLQVLRLELKGQHEKTILFAPIQKAAWQSATMLVVPLGSTLAQWFVIPEGERLVVSSAAESALLHLKLSAYRIAQGPGATLQALDLASLAYSGQTLHESELVRMN
jgi:hypothetical protein